MKKSATYRETFRQHRRLLSLPIVVAVVIAGWFSLGAPKSYQSTTSLWVDNPGSQTTATLDGSNPGTTPPSGQEGNVVKELLATKSFSLAVGHHSPLAAYLASNPSTGWGPTALLSKLGGGGPLNTRILAALGPKQVTTATPGPQVLQISFLGPTPSVAQSTLKAIVNQLQLYGARFSQAQSQTTTAHYQAQVQAATQALSTARDQKNAYLQQHPGATSGDPKLNALTTAVTAAQAKLTQANANLGQAQNGSSAGSPLHVIDSPSVPLGPTSGKKKALLGIVGGLFAGLIISFLGTIALTRAKSGPWEDEHEPPAEAAEQNGGPVDPAGARVAVASPVQAAGTKVAVASPSSPVTRRPIVPGRRSVPDPDAD